MSRKVVLSIVGILAVLFVVLVLVGNVAVAHTNPPVSYQIQWDSPQTEQLARRACFDCHSNETSYPWYSYVAPMSFLVMNDVNKGREAMNFSTGLELEGGDMADEIREGAMPPPIYLPLHPEANLTAAEREQLIAGLIATFGGEGGEQGEDD
jgi:hypothetical protein